MLHFSDMLSLGATLMPPSACVLHVSSSFCMTCAVEAYFQCLMLLQMMAGAMQGSQEDWPSFHRLQGLRPSVGAPFGANDMSAASIGQPLI